MSGKTLKTAVLVLAGVTAAIQFIRPERGNPPSDPALSFEAAGQPSPGVAAIVERGCVDCHSNRTTWPWYSGVAPASWLVAEDVKDGRAELNLSEWGRLVPKASQSKRQAMCAEARDGEMPPWQYRLLHAEAKLGAEDVAALCAGIGSPGVVE